MYEKLHSRICKKQENICLLYLGGKLKPDIRVMKYKNISTISNKLLYYFNEKGQQSFTSKEALIALPNSSKTSVKQLLSDMTRRGLLMRIKKGVYYIIPFDRNPEIYMPDWHLLAKYLVKNREYYIGYYSALQIYNLITQPSLNEQIVVSKQMKPSSYKIKDVTFKFIYHNDNHFFGYKMVWIDDFNKVKCSDLEKTFIDCLFKPDYSGGIVEIAKALYNSEDKIDFDKLNKYTKLFKSQAVIKRLGFLLELLQIDTHIVSDLRKRKSLTYVVLDTELPKKGKRLSRWNIQLNIDIETIISAIYT